MELPGMEGVGGRTLCHGLDLHTGRAIARLAPITETGPCAGGPGRPASESRSEAGAAEPSPTTRVCVGSRQVPHTFVAISTELPFITAFLRQDFISFGSGEPPASEYHSFVLYHNNSPRWAELLKLPIPVDKFRSAHIRFEFRHCSSECPAGPLVPGVVWRRGVRVPRVQCLMVAVG